MEKKRLFNVSGDDAPERRRMIGGNVTNLFNLNNVKYQWANKLYRAMMENFWIPEKVSLLDDKLSYPKLSPAETEAYDGVLSFLVFLDSIQTNNLPNIAECITAPEVALVLAIQTYQEAVHSQSYSYIIESIMPPAKKDAIYDRWREDKILLERNEYIARIYQDFVDARTDRNFARALVANFLLEGVYFYNGFNFFYNLAARSLMIGTADEIKYINRDELTHCVLFSNMIREIRAENPKFFDDGEIRDMFQKAVEQEIAWSRHAIRGVVGIDGSTIEKYTKFIANQRMREIGMNQIYPGYDASPYAHLDAISDTRGAGSVKGNFFEANVSSYNQSSAVGGWDDI
ncbi:MAG: ribonucleotide-diphosphate reductase subunit beta [Rickettsiales bacterium]|jgi:ribonucleoside-diphosphate reductase beta chain|nr:ribonucleotide-diphosphate reductase subunit beta [Rickettsiales bacterium]